MALTLQHVACAGAAQMQAPAEIQALIVAEVRRQQALQLQANESSKKIMQLQASLAQEQAAEKMAQQGVQATTAQIAALYAHLQQQ